MALTLADLYKQYKHFPSNYIMRRITYGHTSATKDPGVSNIKNPLRQGRGGEDFFCECEIMGATTLPPHTTLGTYKRAAPHVFETQWMEHSRNMHLPPLLSYPQLIKVYYPTRNP
jgi:hypothetical protein